MTTTHRDACPTVSVVLPALNERRWIRDCLGSLLAQDYGNVIEILVVDGGSTDGTRDIAGHLDPLIRVVDNPQVTAAAAMNIGIAESKGEVVCRIDAHAIFAPDYVRRCVEVLLETGADNVGGLMRPVGTTSFGRAVAAATTSRFGVGPGRFHYAGQRQDVDTVWLGCWWRTTLDEVGGYDEESLQWGAEDQELNLRLRQRGGRVVLDPGIRSSYFPRQTPSALARQYFNYGLDKASTLRKHRTLPSWRPLAPAALVASTVAAGLFGRGWKRVAIPAVHLAACAAAAVKPARDPGVAPHRLVAAFAICHWSHGAGFWAGVGRIVRGAGFDTRPQGHR
jgi:glycosyltransferase involved in cell wall biosynthesis